MSAAHDVLARHHVPGVGTADIIATADGHDLVTTDRDGHVLTWERDLPAEHAFHLWFRECDWLDSRPVRHTAWDRDIARALHPARQVGRG